MQFAKYHGLGNAYLVVEPEQLGGRDPADVAKRLSNDCFGIGSDGILLGPLPSDTAQFRLQIFNPDGSEAEKSGNGLRIFARYLWDKKRVDEAPFSIETLGGLVKAQVFDSGKQVEVQMGKARFTSDSVGLSGPSREALNETFGLPGRDLTFCAVSVGNPHCVVLDGPSAEGDVRDLGPLIENDPRFANRTNVQFLRVIDRNTIAIQIWERGAGYTLASGSSSTAAASAAKKLGLCDSPVTVQMPGGELRITIDDDFETTMLGPVAKIAEGRVAEEALS